MPEEHPFPIKYHALEYYTFGYLVDTFSMTGRCLFCYIYIVVLIDPICLYCGSLICGKHRRTCFYA